VISLKSLILTLLSCVAIAVNCRAATFVITSNADSGPGTLRQALTDAAATGGSVSNNITFNLPAGQQTINVLSPLPAITSSLIIDGSTQPGSPLSANGAKVVLAGPGAGTQIDCLTVQSAADFEVYGLIIKEFCFILSNGYATGNSAISLIGTCNKVIIGAPGKGNVLYDNGTGINNAPLSPTAPVNIASCQIQNNYIGVMEDGNSFDGITGNSIVLSYSQQILIGGNTTAEGNAVFGNLTISPHLDGTGSVISNNVLGASAGYVAPLAFSSANTQVYLNSDITNASQVTTFLVNNNVFATTLSVTGFTNINLTVQSNIWGESPNGNLPLYVSGPAITLSNITGTTLIGGPSDSYGNTITNTVYGSTAIINKDAVIEATQATTVELSHNSMFCNNNLPFEYMNTTAATKPMFITLNAVTGSGVSGTTKPNARVEVFYTDSKCTGCEPQTYIASVNADASGNWVYSGTINSAFNVVANATLNKISSEFSDPEIDISNMQKQDVTCNSLGSITGITATNVNQAQWFNATTSEPVGPPGYDLENAQPGQYYLVLDQFGCYFQSPVYTINNDAPQLDETLKETTGSTCGLANGSITGLTASNYLSIQWLDANGNVVGSNINLTNVVTGSYMLRLYGPDCHSDFGPFEIDNTNDVISISGASAQITPEGCGLGNGSIKEVSATGGTGTLKYSWTNESNNIVSTTADATNLPAGNYTLTVTDASCGNASQVFTVKEQDEAIPVPTVNNVKICGNTAVLKVENPQNGYTYKLYSDAYSTTPLQTDASGVFTVSVPTNTSFYISEVIGTCESARVQVVITHGNDLGTIPNTFTPNGDGINDYWQLGDLAAYPQALVQVFNRYGQQVYQSKGYSIPWDGTYKGSPLPVGTYYYIINLGSSACSILSGYVAILR
jgi:gliding motility-associated-like protein